MITSTTPVSNIICTIRQFNEPKGSGQRPLPNCHLLCVWAWNLVPESTHPLLVPSCDRKKDYAWWVQIPIPAHAYKRIPAPNGIIPETRPNRPALTWCAWTSRRGFCMTGIILKLRINLMPIRNFNKAIYNIKLWLIYIKMISTTQGTYWCYQIHFIYKFT